MNATQAYGGGEVCLHEFLTLALHGNEWFASCSGLFIAGKKMAVPYEQGIGLAKFGRCGEEKVSCHCQQSNYDTVQYLQYKLHMIYSSYGISFVYEVNIVITRF